MSAASERCIRSVMGHELFHTCSLPISRSTSGRSGSCLWKAQARDVSRTRFTPIWIPGMPPDAAADMSAKTPVFWPIQPYDLGSELPTSLSGTYLNRATGYYQATRTYGGSDFAVTLWQRAQANNDPPGRGQGCPRVHCGLIPPTAWSVHVPGFQPSTNLHKIEGPDGDR